MKNKYFVKRGVIYLKDRVTGIGKGEREKLPTTVQSIVTTRFGPAEVRSEALQPGLPKGLLVRSFCLPSRKEFWA